MFAKADGSQRPSELPLPTLCGLRRAKIFRPLARAVHHGQHVHLIAHLIGHDVGSSRQHQLAGAGDAAHSPDHGIVGKESVRPLGNVVHKPERSGEVVLRDVIRDRLKTFEGGARPDNPHQLGQYLARSRSKSAGVAKRPAAALSKPARTLSTTRSCHSSEWPCSSASATTSAGERLDRAATASTRACSSGAIFRASAMTHYATVSGSRSTRARGRVGDTRSVQFPKKQLLQLRQGLPSAGKLDEPSAAPLGFQREAARAVVPLTGFYLFTAVRAGRESADVQSMRWAA